MLTVIDTKIKNNISAANIFKFYFKENQYIKYTLLIIPYFYKEVIQKNVLKPKNDSMKLYLNVKTDYSVAMVILSS